MSSAKCAQSIQQVARLLHCRINLAILVTLTSMSRLCHFAVSHCQGTSINIVASNRLAWQGLAGPAKQHLRPRLRTSSQARPLTASGAYPSVHGSDLHPATCFIAHCELSHEMYQNNMQALTWLLMSPLLSLQLHVQSSSLQEACNLSCRFWLINLQH